MSASVPTRWLVLEIPRPVDEGWSERVIEELVDYAGGVEERPGLLLIYLPDPVRQEGVVIAEVDALLAAMDGGVGPSVTAHRWQLHEEWGEVWRRGFTARRITPRLVVSPTWESPTLEPGEILLSLDPGMAFGTAQHPTTRGSLRLLDPLVSPGERIADIGAGSGILSIAAALLGARRVIAVEMDSWSCAAARENALLNHVADRVEVREDRVGQDLIPGEPPFDGLLANIESGILLPLLPSFAAGVRESGWIVLSGILQSEAEGIVRAAEAVGFVPIAEDREEEWWTGSFRMEG
jgi:ribosomal protein L11 methyltransferase